MRTSAALTSAAVALVTAALAGAAEPGPSNFGVQLLSTFDDATGTVHNGPATSNRVFVLPTFVGSYELPDDPDERPVDTQGVRSATYAIDFPDGLVVQPPASVHGGGYSGTSTTCTRGCAIDIASGRLGVNALYRLLARQPGTYPVTMRITSRSRPDPDPLNDEITVQIAVRASSAAQVTAGKLVALPAVPRAGRTYVLTLPLARAGAAVTPSRVRCTATVAGHALAATRAALPGRARCTWQVPVGTAGKTLRARIVASAGGHTFSASRAARVR